MKRYDVETNDNYDMTEKPDGIWVMHDDVASAIADAVAAERERYSDLMLAVEWLLDDGHMNQEHLARLRAAYERAERKAKGLTTARTGAREQ